MSNPLKEFAREVLDRLVGRLSVQEKTSPQTKIALRQLFLNYRGLAEKGETLPRIEDTGFRIFSQFEEDGVLLFLLAVAGSGPSKFVDIGAGDGYNGSNTANLALNLNYHGLFIEANEASVKRGIDFYKSHPDSWLYPPIFRQSMVNRSNINQVIHDAGFEGEIDLLSIDIDGNDYWIWESINVVKPRIVIIETHVEFGMNSVVVPYDENFVITIHKTSTRVATGSHDCFDGNRGC